MDVNQMQSTSSGTPADQSCSHQHKGSSSLGEARGLDSQAHPATGRSMEAKTAAAGQPPLAELTTGSRSRGMSRGDKAGRAAAREAARALLHAERKAWFMLVSAQG